MHFILNFTTDFVKLNEVGKGAKEPHLLEEDDELLEATVLANRRDSRDNSTLGRARAGTRARLNDSLVSHLHGLTQLLKDVLTVPVELRNVHGPHCARLHLRGISRHNGITNNSQCDVLVDPLQGLNALAQDFVEAVGERTHLLGDSVVVGNWKMGIRQQQIAQNKNLSPVTTWGGIITADAAAAKRRQRTSFWRGVKQIFHSVLRREEGEDWARGKARVGSIPMKK